MATPGSASPAGGRLAGSLRTIAVIVTTAVVIGVVAFLVDRPTSASGGTTNLSLSGQIATEPPKPGEVPPDFTVATTDGRVVHLADLKGQPVWLNFGASWCSQCRAEAPDIEAAYERYKAQGLVVLAVFQEEVASASDYAKRVGLTFPVGVDPDTQIASRYDILGIPTQVFIGRDGVVRAFRIGGLKPDDMDRYIQEILR